jgi:hypothetical protein
MTIRYHAVMLKLRNSLGDHTNARLRGASCRRAQPLRA